MLEHLIRSIQDFPKPGILFRDVTTLFKDAAGFRTAIDALAGRHRDHAVARVAGIEARGFIVGAALAHALGAGFVPLRKPGKLPAASIGEDYALEYGSDRLELHRDAIAPGERVLIADDLIATGGTAQAAVRLVRHAGGEVVECCFLMGGMARLAASGQRGFALMAFAGR